jgi:outer membrane immunogenic protein
MRKIALASLALLGLTDLSAAADLPVKALPMPAPVFTWTGLYVGGNFGWGWGEGAITEGPPGSARFPVGTVFNTNHSNGFLGGVQAGFNYQTPYNLVVGVEGEWDWTNIRGTVTTFTPVPAFAGFSVTNTDKIKDIAALTGRVGYAAGNWLFYGKGGVALDQTSTSGVNTNPNGTLNDTFSNSTDRSGWIVGAGIEWGFAAGWSAKIEYEHFDFGSAAYPSYHISATTGAFSVSNVSSTEKIDVVKGGINYRFNWGAPGY